jgi:hypothetical protein
MARGLPLILSIDVRRPRATPWAAAWDYEFTAATDRDMPDGEARFGGILKKFPEGWKAVAHEALPWPREGHARRRDAVQAALADIHAMLDVFAAAHRVLAQTTAEDDAKVTARFAVEMLSSGTAR